MDCLSADQLDSSPKVFCVETTSIYQILFKATGVTNFKSANAMRCDIFSLIFLSVDLIELLYQKLTLRGPVRP